MELAADVLLRVIPRASQTNATIIAYANGESSLLLGYSLTVFAMLILSMSGH